jgi:hypothetical protein
LFAVTLSHRIANFSQEVHRHEAVNGPVVAPQIRED